MSSHHSNPIPGLSQLRVSANGYHDQGKGYSSSGSANGTRNGTVNNTTSFRPHAPPHIQGSDPHIPGGPRRTGSTPNMYMPDVPSTFASTQIGKKKLKGSDRDVEHWQFWPHAMAMGSSTRNTFTQMFGSRCRHGANREDRGYGFSYLAFNFKKETLVDKSEFQLTAGSALKRTLPVAFSPLDAELPFSDISLEGIRIKETRRSDGKIDLTVTVTSRRPPRFFTAFAKTLSAGKGNGEGHTRSAIYRRRATAMDFVLEGQDELYAGILLAVPQGAIANPTFWDTYRWTFIFTQAEADLFRRCANKLRMLSEVNPELVLISQRPDQLIDRPRPMTDWHFPDLKQLDFATRALIEGLVGSGILIPGDTTALVEALRLHAPSEHFRHYLLETLFTDSRIRDPTSIVKGKPSILLLSDLRPCSFPPSATVGPRCGAPRSNSLRPGDTDPRARLPPSAGDQQLRHPQVCGQARRHHPRPVCRRGRSTSRKVTVFGGNLPSDHGLHQARRHAGEVHWPHGSCTPRPATRHHDCGSTLPPSGVIIVTAEGALDVVYDRVELAQWMGMPKEKVVAKYAARMGLPFSASRAVDFNFQVTRWDDIERLGNCFTDGCSIAGFSVMKEAASALGSRGLNVNPSAIQFRLGGAKGVLAYWPGMVTDEEIRLRKSQEKFSSKLEDLNVIRVSHYQVGFLNRQFINIMSALGVPDSLFIQLFEEEVKSIRGLAQRVRENVPTEKDMIYLGIYTSFPMGLLAKNRFNRNPFVEDMCNLTECRALQDLKWRARIRLPQSVYLIGINDETGLLKEGELFCQYQKDENSTPVIVKGKVLICRAPALHPGDVRHANAVDLPLLRHLKNVIVFNTCGPRPLPNMLGGGDLDGDDYTLIWDQRFVQRLKEHEPMDYTAPKPKTVDKVQQEHLNENFVQYILNDVLGQVDNAHLANSDIKTPRDKVCLRLAEVHSAAVDFAKTGIAVDVDPEWFPRKWPDFMGKDDEKTYISSKILGILFRQVHPMPTWDPTDIKEIDYPFDSRFEKWNLDPHLIDALIPVKLAFEQEMTYTMRRYRVQESEVVAGIAAQTKARKRSRQLSHLHEPLKDAWDVHTAVARERAMEAATHLNEKHKLNFEGLRHIVAAHAFALTYKKELVERCEKAVASESLRGMHGADEMFRPRPMLSFAWVWAMELVDLAQFLSRQQIATK